MTMNVRIGKKLGKGSFGTVYRARDASGNAVAVKLVETDDPVSRELLRRQFEFLSSLDHKRVVRALDFDGDTPRGPLMVLEFVDGSDLRTYVSRHGPGQLDVITAKLLDALRYVHSQGKCHGDLKPESIMVFEEAGSPEVKLIDAGLDAGRAANLPTLAGTLPYMAPEMIRNLPHDARSDLYSLGVVLQEMLTGDCPFRGADAEEILRKHLEYQPPAPSAVNPALPAVWDEFVANLVRKEPELRYKDASHAGLELERLFGNNGIFTANLVQPNSAPLVERDRQMEDLAGHLDSAEPKAALICGERGCGISRIMHELGCAYRSRGDGVFTVELSRDMPAMVQIVDAILGGARPAAGAVRPSPKEAPSESSHLERLLEVVDSHLSKTKRHLLLIDRGETMRPDELVAIGALARQMGDRLRVLVGYQTEEGAAGAVKNLDTYRTFAVGPLSESALEELLRRHLGVSAVPADLVERLHRTTRGNPGLIHATVTHLRNTGSLRFGVLQGVLALVWDRSVELPVTVKEIMLAKLGELSPAAIEALGMMSICEGRIEKDILAEALPQWPSGEVLDELFSGGLVKETEDHISIQMRQEGISGVIKGRLEPADRKRIAERLVALMEPRAAGSGDTYRLGLLYLEGGRLTEAFGRLSESGDVFSRYSANDAILAYTKALECGPEPSRLAEIHEKIGDLHLARGDLDASSRSLELAAEHRPTARRKLAWVMSLKGDNDSAVGILKECRSAAAERGEIVEEARVLCDLGYISAVRGDRMGGVQSLRKALSLFEACDLAADAGGAANRLGIVEIRSGNFKGALHAWEVAKAHFEKCGSRKRVAACLMNLGLCHLKQIDFALAEQSFRDALDIFEDVKWLYEKASCCQNYALLLIDRGELAHARNLAIEARNINTILGRASGIITSAILLAAIALEYGNRVEAEACLRQLLEGDYRPDDFQAAMIKRYLAVARSAAGCMQEALDLLGDSYDLARRAGDSEGQGQALLEMGKVYLRFEKGEQAVEFGRKALTALGLSSSLLLASEAQRVTGEALCIWGRLDEGIAVLMEAKEGFGQLEDSLHMARVFRALARAYYLVKDQNSSRKYLRDAADRFLRANARYDYGMTVLLGGKEAVSRGSLLEARHYLLEASRIFKTLEIQDLYEEALGQMEQIPSGDLEIRAVTLLSRISQALSSCHDLTTVLNKALDLAMEYLGADRGVVLLNDDATQEMITFAERKMDQESIREAIGVSKSIVDSVRFTREAVIAADATKDPRFRNSQSVRIHNIMSVMCVPLMKGDRLLGIIYLDNRGVPSEFSKLERAFVGAFANQVALAIENAKMVGKLYEDFADLKARAGERYSFANIIGPGKKMQEVFRQVEKAASSTITILLTGESGTGKELIAGLVHELSPRRDRPLVKVNCAAIQKDLLETELFGIEKKVATGVAPRSGFFERANGGTLLLDEVGDMPLTTQMRVLRVLAEKEFERVGGSRVVKVDVRVISATNQDLKGLISEGRFRTDLYFRLNAMRIHLPALKDRIEDLPMLVSHFIGKYADQNSKPRMRISDEAFIVLKHTNWEGNVRQLEKCIEHAVVIAEGPQIGVEHLPADVREGARDLGMQDEVGPGRLSLPEDVRQLERRRILAALEEANWVITAAAALLGIHESTLRKKMRILRISRVSRQAPVHH